MNVRVWRLLAFAIAIAAFLDPGFDRKGSSRPVIAVVARDADSSASRKVQGALRHDFTVVEGVLPGVAATVVVGDRVPDLFAGVAGPVFGVTPGDSRIAIVDATAPPRAPLDSRVPVALRTRVRHSRGDSVVVTLRSGEAVIDRAAHAIASDDESISHQVWFVPVADGAHPLHITAELAGSGSRADADLLVNVDPKRWPVLFFDRRPSWTSTFVRRAIERDPRFVVTSRVITSRNVSTDAGQPPENFDAIAAGELYDAVVVGAPELLTDRDVAGLDAFMRRRGGTVVLLFDARADGRYERLTQVSAWGMAAGDSASFLNRTDADSIRLKASEIAWPADLPLGAEQIVGASGNGRLSSQRSVVWRSGVGAGRLIVSGALDAWAYRDTASSGFDAFWRRTIAEAVAATPSPVSVRTAQQVVRPNQRIPVTALVRDPVDDSVPVVATLETNDARTTFRLWPSGQQGAYSGFVRAPEAPGIYRIAATSAASRGEVAIAVSSDASAPQPVEDDLLETWIGSRRGRTVSSAELSRLPEILRQSAEGKTHAERWFPMRSVWWIIPFSLALGAEWWWRRRRGMA